VSTSSHTGDSLYSATFTRRTALVLGEESRGVSKDTHAHADITLAIPGTGFVESLNVASSTALMLGFWHAQSLMVPSPL
jgi:tRNA G18 (ribose-2'-O)-methylase SpoU